MTSRFPTSHGVKRQGLHAINHLIGPDDDNKMKKQERSLLHSSWALVLQRLLVKIRIKQAAILQAVVFLSVTMLVLNANGHDVGQLNRSIVPQDLPRYYRAHPLMIRYDDPLQKMSQKDHIYETKRLIKEWTKYDAERQEDLRNDTR